MSLTFIAGQTTKGKIVQFSINSAIYKKNIINSSTFMIEFFNIFLPGYDYKKIDDIIIHHFGTKLID